MRLCVLILTLVGSAQASNDALTWEFDDDRDTRIWQPNADLTNVTIANGALKAYATGTDPFLLCRDVTIATRPWQYVVLRMKANRAGIGELFWSGQLEGKYGGLTEQKKVRFWVRGDSQWEEIVLFPFWHTEGTVRQLRLDVYEGADFEIDSICILEWGRGLPPSSVCIWTPGGEASEWRIHPSAPERFAPPVHIDVGDKTWVAVELASDTDGVAAVLWAREDAPGMQSQEFLIRGDGKRRVYNVRMADVAAWRGRIVAFGIRPPEGADIRLESIRIGTEPFGPGELEVSYFGFENGVNRAGRPCRLIAQITNLGGSAQSIREVHLNVGSGLEILSQPALPGHEGIEHGDYAVFAWEITAPQPGAYPVHLSFSGKGNMPPGCEAVLQFSKPPAVARATYVPEPKPVRTDIELCAFYFPGWESDGKWDCIRRVAPVRKPLLGYYDESNPECVDWQIKWAVENGISCFLVDWYWVQSRQQLTHWFEAYRKARYRDYLSVAVMWANHNPPNTHSVDDWLKVAKHWIDEYFSLKSYYHLDGMPAAFIWHPWAIRSDLGGSEIVRQAFAQSQDMARAAGFKGITLVAMGHDFSASHVEALLQEGYRGITNYHEWGPKIDAGVSRKRFTYEDVVRDSPIAWQTKDNVAGALAYYPLVDTGWDSRPWHGHKAMVVQGRTPERFEELLLQARSFCRQRNKSVMILGPVNEWGEGSYIEPCTEFGFDMLQAVRRVFTEGPAESWPINLSPADIGLGPYDFSANP